MAKSKIPWCDDTWNPFTGCSKASAGCEHCYAAAIANRFNGGDFTPKFHPERLDYPAKVKKGRMIFVCSVSDLFHENHNPADVRKVFDAMTANPQHVYQILTKRPVWMKEHFEIQGKPIPDNWWLGVTVENNAGLHRLDTLRQISAKHKFVSFEPLLEAIDKPDLTGIDWVIAGGETGHGARLCDPKWILDLWNLCYFKDIPFFFKQWGTCRDNSFTFGEDLKRNIEATRQFPPAMAEHLGREL